MTGLNSVAGWISQLQDDQPEIQELALRNLDRSVNEFWHEISSDLPYIEKLYESGTFKHRELAALVASKVYYHLDEYNQAMQYALGAGKLFEVSQKTEYVNTLVARFIDEYIRLRTIQVESKDGSSTKIDPRLESIVLGMFERCYQEKQYKQALGVAVEIRRLDRIEEAITRSDNVMEMLSWAQKVGSQVITNREFRTKVYRLLIQIYDKQPQPDYLRISEILAFLEDSKTITDILDRLIRSGNKDDWLLAYQIGFDLVENAAQHILLRVRNTLNNDPSATPAAPTNADSMEIDTSSGTGESGKEEAVESNNSSNSLGDRKQKLSTILSGEKTIALYMDFLVRNNHTDLLILKNIKQLVESRSSVLHTATIFANAFMHCGTTIDQFLRENLEWLARATNWAKFSAIAGLGIIHKGHMKEGLSLLGPYLPQAGNAGSPYSEGGSLFALGIIHANHVPDDVLQGGATSTAAAASRNNNNIVQYMIRALRNANGNDIVQHGACLGLGVASMAMENEEVYEEIKAILYLDSAVAGEAAGIAMGLVQLGSASQKAVSEMVQYAHETQHEKIIRGLAIGLAVTMYGREEEADTLIEQLLLDKDPILRYGAVYTIGLAYAGTSNNAAIKRLLHVAVSDVSDDVRRAAVSCLGFLLFRNPEQCPKVVSLLAESYNPNVRYGSCLALGISCAGTALKEAIDILEPLASDVVDFVRQGALIALAMVLIQTNKQQEPKVDSFRKMLDEKIADKHEDTMCKFGAILAAGMIDAGGRNMTIALQTRSGEKNMNGIVGLALFMQYWYWYPLTYFVGLAFTPTAFIGLNKDLRMPVYSFKSNARPSLFAYPPPTTPPTAAAPQKVKQAVLSVTNKAAQKKKDAMDVDKPAVDTTADGKKEDKDGKEEKKEGKEEKKEDAADKPEKKKREPEADHEVKQNPSRITLAQAKYLSFEATERYELVRRDGAGITMLRDKRSDQPEELVTPANNSASSTSKIEEEPEPEPPKPFIYDPTAK